MNDAIKEGFHLGLGYGASLARHMDLHPEKFPHRADSIIYQAYSLGVPQPFILPLGQISSTSIPRQISRAGRCQWS